ncbi:MAG: transpeptidase family protein [Calditrichaceae bacterium]|nr:transpeptidase family protein [Calditrichaceae bacterium]
MLNRDDKINRLRLSILVVIIAGFWGALEINLFRIQIVNHDRLSRIAYNQYEKRIILPARRGSICDRNGHLMAATSIHYDIAADPKMIKDRGKAAACFARVFNKSESYFRGQLKKNTHFIYLERKVDKKKVDKILALNDPGIIILDNFRRDYPFGSDGGQLLGFTDTDDHGISGLELIFEKELAGEAGEAVLQYDGPRRVFYNADYPIRAALSGNDVFLTIDKNIQTIVEDELESGVKNAHAATGMAVVLDPYSGAVLAMANYPRFNPNRQEDYPLNVKRNRVITDVFEPGSTLKIFTAASLLQDRLRNTDDIVFCENGSYQIYDRRFTDTKKYGWLSFRRVVENSSNVGMIKLSADLHPKVFFRYLKNFGFGEKSLIELPGEAAGFLEQPMNWSGISRASISIGYEIGVTALQMTAAYAAIVNGGYLYRPFVVSHLRTLEGDIIRKTEPEVIRQVISPEVSDILKNLMLGVVQRGTGTRAALQQINVGGKTGTAKKYDHKRKQYLNDRYLGSFVGFASYEQPKYICAVFIDDPRNGYYGGEVAGPVFNRIIHRIFNLQQAPQLPILAGQDREENRTANPISDLPELAGFNINAAVALLDEKDIKYEIAGRGQYVKDVAKDKNHLVIKTGPLRLNSDRTPNLVGLTLKEALNRLNLEKFKIALEGDRSGIITMQSIKPGTMVEQRTTLTVRLAN